MLLETPVLLLMLYMIVSLVLRILCYDSKCCLSPDVGIGYTFEATPSFRVTCQCFLVIFSCTKVIISWRGVHVSAIQSFIYLQEKS